EDADRPGMSLGVVARIFERLPRGFEEEAMLRIDHLRFARADAEKRRVEELRAVEHPARRHVGRVVDDRGVDAGLPELLLGETRDGLDAVVEVPPECVERGRAGKPPGHPDDRDGLVRGHRTPAGAAPRAMRSASERTVGYWNISTMVRS